MIKFVKISKKDIIFDRKNASDILTKACGRAKPMRVSGAFEIDERIVIALEASVSLKTYSIVPFDDGSEDGIIGEINARYPAGFTFCFAFRIDDSTLGIFCS